MIETITQQSKSWCERYILEKDAHYKQIAMMLTEQIPSVESISQFKNILDSISMQLTQSPSFFQNPLDPFHTKLNEWITTVNQLNGWDLQAVESILDKIKTSENTKDVIILLKDTLASPKAMLHLNVQPLLRHLTDEDYLQKLMDHLADLPFIPYPEHPAAGTFAAIPARNKEHKTCLMLLNNNSKAYQENNLNNQNANQFLQSLLQIDLYLHTEKKPSPPMSESWCTIL